MSTTPSIAALPHTRHNIDWLTLWVVASVHLLATAAFLPWLFSWTGVVLAFAGLYVFGTLGINIGFHRLLTHRSFNCPSWLEYTLALLGVCCLQKSPGQFVATHRMHHAHPDGDGDPHSPLVTFFWGHMGWLFAENDRVSTLSNCIQYAKDIYRNPFYLRLDKNVLWLQVFVAHALAYFAAGFLVGWLLPGGSVLAGTQFGLSLLVWGVMVRTVLVWHITWSVNSLAHLWGYRTYPGHGNSRNNFFVGIISNGEGWHNNHHADQRSAAHGQRWWELDVSYLTIRGLESVGLAWDVVRPRSWSAPETERREKIGAGLFFLGGLLAVSNIKRDTAAGGVFLEDFAGCAVAESLLRTIIQ